MWQSFVPCVLYVGKDNSVLMWVMTALYPVCFMWIKTALWTHQPHTLCTFMWVNFIWVFYWQVFNLVIGDFWSEPMNPKAVSLART